MKTIMQHNLGGCSVDISDNVYEVHRLDGLRWRDIYIPNFMTIVLGIQVILWVYLNNLRGYTADIDEMDL
jgi:hypothetical protein